MSKNFENCVSNKGRVRRISGPNKRFGLTGGEYVNVCFINGKMNRGEVYQKERVDIKK